MCSAGERLRRLGSDIRKCSRGSVIVGGSGFAMMRWPVAVRGRSTAVIQVPTFVDVTRHGNGTGSGVNPVATAVGTDAFFLGRKRAGVAQISALSLSWAEEGPPHPLGEGPGLQAYKSVGVTQPVPRRELGSDHVREKW